MSDRILFPLLVGAALLVAICAVSAQTNVIPSGSGSVWTSFGGSCISGNIQFPARGNTCFSEDMRFGYPILGTATTAISSGVTITHTKQPKCAGGWSLVDTGSRAMCARELREPE